ncbi:MAG: hypothetical protein V1701_12505 [Planctomycetota bacterium]
MKTLKQLIVVLGLITAALSIGVWPAMAASAAVNHGNLLAQGIFPLPGPGAYGNVPAPPEAVTGAAKSNFALLAWGLIQNVRYIIGALAVAMIVYAGFRMVIGWGKEEVYSTQRTSILYAILGLAIVGLAGEFANIFQVACPESLPGQPTVPCTQGGFLSDPNSLIRTALLFNQTTQIIITFIKYAIGAIAVLMIVRNGLRMITMGSSEDKIAVDKKNLAYSAVGLILIIIADTVINKVLYKVDLSKYPGIEGVKPAFDPQSGINEIVGFTNFVVSIVGPIGVLALLAGGVMYITAGGKEDKMDRAKRLVMAAAIGLIVIYGAFAIVSTFIVGSF